VKSLPVEKIWDNKKINIKKVSITTLKSSILPLPIAIEIEGEKREKK
jgi:hypothetical protein